MRPHDTGGYLIYHPERDVSTFGQYTVFHDSFAGNQDPYIWTPQFLHSYCHITQMSPRKGDINFWVSGDTGFKTFNYLYCDLVFVVQDKVYWPDANAIAPTDTIVDSPEAFKDHYAWHKQHPLSRRRRFTLKADEERSFQPQSADHVRLDLVAALNKLDYDLGRLRQGMYAGLNSQPVPLPRSVADKLYAWVVEASSVQLRGPLLQQLRHGARVNSANEEAPECGPRRKPVTSEPSGCG